MAGSLVWARQFNVFSQPSHLFICPQHLWPLLALNHIFTGWYENRSSNQMLYLWMSTTESISFIFSTIIILYNYSPCPGIILQTCSQRGYPPSWPRIKFPPISEIWDMLLQPCRTSFSTECPRVELINWCKTILRVSYLLLGLAASLSGLEEGGKWVIWFIYERKLSSAATTALVNVWTTTRNSVHQCIQPASQEDRCLIDADDLSGPVRGPSSGPSSKVSTTCVHTQTAHCYWFTI